MTRTVYVFDPDLAERRWIEDALASGDQTLVFVDDADALLGQLPVQPHDCLVCGAEHDGSGALELVRSLRRRGQRLPVVVIGPHSAFRSAVDLARLEGTDFVERPGSAQRLRAALRNVTRSAVAAR